MIYESRSLNSAFNTLPIYIQSNQLTCCMSLKVVSAQLKRIKAEGCRQQPKSGSSEWNSNEDFPRTLRYHLPGFCYGSPPVCLIFHLLGRKTTLEIKKDSAFCDRLSKPQLVHSHIQISQEIECFSD